MKSSEKAEGDAEHRASTVVEIIGAWALVGIPLAWGVFQVAVKSFDLFR